MSPPAAARLRPLLPWLLVGALWLGGFPALRQYNVTWDEALGDLFFGERYFSFFTSFDARYLDFQNDPYPEARQPSLFASPFKIRPWEYYPVANTLAAATSELLARRLGLLDVFDGFHALNLLLVALLVPLMFGAAAKRDGTLAALAAVVLLFSAPRVVCDLFANIKDFPLLVFFAAAALLFFQAWEEGSRRGMLVAAAVLALALGTKANALFFPAIPALLWLAGGTPPSWQGRRGQLITTGLLAAALTLGLVFLLWPYLWAHPIERIGEHLRYISQRKGYTKAESLAPAFEAVLFTTPPFFLLLAGAGALLSLRDALRERSRWAIFLLAWPAVVLGRFLLPMAVNFDGVRHFLELFPALALLAGRAVGELTARLRGWAGQATALRRALPAVATTILLLPGLLVTLLAHPFEVTYWNGLVGGYAGARAKNLPQASDYWGMSYRLGLDWLARNADQNAYVAVPVVEHAVRLVAPLRLRPDLQLLPLTRPFNPRIAPERLEATRELARQGPVYVMFVERRDWMNELMSDCLEHLEPEMVWTYDGEPVLSIYRYRPP